MKDYLKRLQAAGPATSQSGGKSVTVSSTEPPETPAAREFMRLCVDHGGAEVMEERWEQLCTESPGVRWPTVPSGTFDVYEHAPGWSGHFATFHQFPFGTEEYYEREARRLKERVVIEYPSSPMEGFGTSEGAEQPLVRTELLDEQARLNEEEGEEPMLIGGLVPEAFARRLTDPARVRNGWTLLDQELIRAKGLEPHLAGMPDLERENRDRWEIERMKLEMWQDLSSWWVWEMPEPDERFYVLGDPSSGAFDGDRAAICWWSIDRMRTLAMWEGHVYLECLGGLVTACCQWLNEGRRSRTEAVIDTTKSDAQLAARTVEGNGETVFYRKNRGVTGQKGGERRSTIGMRFGLDVKEECGDALNSLLLAGSARIRDPRAIAQLRKIVWRTKVGKDGRVSRVLVTVGDTHEERADDLADTVLMAAGMQLNEAEYRRGVKPGESIQRAAERERRAQQRRIVPHRSSPAAEGRIRVR